MSNNVKSIVLHTAAKMFLSVGYEKTSIRALEKETGVSYGSIMNAFGCKESILCELVAFVLEGQFEATSKLLKDKTDDKILFYATETVLQLYMAESSEHIREMYNVSYSMPETSKIIYKTITGKLEDIFKEHLPDLVTKDFYCLELATAGIMRNYLSRPCDMFFTMEMKVEKFLELTFTLYQVQQNKIKETIDFIRQFDFKKIAQNTIDNMLSYLESKV